MGRESIRKQAGLRCRHERPGQGAPATRECESDDRARAAVLDVHPTPERRRRALGRSKRRQRPPRDQSRWLPERPRRAADNAPLDNSAEDYLEAAGRSRRARTTDPDDPDQRDSARAGTLQGGLRRPIEPDAAIEPFGFTRAQLEAELGAEAGRGPAAVPGQCQDRNSMKRLGPARGSDPLSDSRPALHIPRRPIA